MKFDPTAVLDLSPKDAAVLATMFLISQADKLVSQPYTELAQGLVALCMFVVWSSLTARFPGLDDASLSDVGAGPELAVKSSQDVHDLFWGDGA